MTTVAGELLSQRVGSLEKRLEDMHLAMQVEKDKNVRMMELTDSVCKTLEEELNAALRKVTALEEQVAKLHQQPPSYTPPPAASPPVHAAAVTTTATAGVSAPRTVKVRASGTSELQRQHMNEVREKTWQIVDTIRKELYDTTSPGYKRADYVVKWSPPSTPLPMKDIWRGYLEKEKHLDQYIALQWIQTYFLCDGDPTTGIGFHDPTVAIGTHCISTDESKWTPWNITRVFDGPLTALKFTRVPDGEEAQLVDA